MWGGIQEQVRAGKWAWGDIRAWTLFLCVTLDRAAVEGDSGPFVIMWTIFLDKIVQQAGLLLDS